MSHPEESHRGSSFQCSILDVILLSEVFGVLNRCYHPFHCEESCQIGSVRWDDDQCEEPPNGTDNPRRSSLKGSSTKWKFLINDVLQIFFFWMWNQNQSKKIYQTLGDNPDVCFSKVPVMNQNELDTENWFSTTSTSDLQGCGLFHSYGENLAMTNMVKDTRTYAASM